MVQPTATDPPTSSTPVAPVTPATVVATTAAAGASTSPVPLLMVEDNVHHVRLLREALDRGDLAYTLFSVGTVEQARCFLQKREPFAEAPKPAIIVLDLHLPDGSGLDIMRWLKEQPTLRRTPVVVFSSNSDPNVVQQCYDAHANCYVVKPQGNDRFVETASAIRRFWLSTALLSGD